MDSFYVSVERLRDPSLNGKPVAVGGTPDGRGVVASASYEARKFGVRSAMPMGQAIRLCPGLVIVSGGYSRYSEFSDRIAETLFRFTPQVQVASQDEAYLDMAGTENLWGPPLIAGPRIREAILSETKLPCSLGIAANKLVAKVASALCKPKGMLYIPEGSEERFFAPLPVRKLPGVGPQTLKKLHELGISTMGDLAKFDPRRLERHFGQHGPELAQRARGISNSRVVVSEPAKSVGAEETFHRDAVDPEFLESILSNLSEKVAYRLRRNECRATTITLKLRYHDFETLTVATTLSTSTDDEGDLFGTARELLYRRWNRARPIRLLGVTASGLQYEEEQLDLLQQPTDERKLRLHAAIDATRKKHGYGAVKRASSGGVAEEKNDRQWGG